MCKDTSVVPVFAEATFVFSKLFVGIEFVNVIFKQSPTFARNTSGRGLLSGRSWVPAPPTVSLLSAKIKASGMAAPMRFNMIGWGRATTAALIVRIHWGGGGGLIGWPSGGSALASTGAVAEVIAEARGGVEPDPGSIGPVSTIALSFDPIKACPSARPAVNGNRAANAR